MGNPTEKKNKLRRLINEKQMGSRLDGGGINEWMSAAAKNHRNKLKATKSN